MLRNNLLLKSILDKFTLTTDLPITCLDKKESFKLVSSASNYFLKDDEIDFIKSKIRYLDNYYNKKSIEFINLDYNKEVAAIYISSNNKINNYFIIGPFVSNNITMSSYPHKPKNCFRYLFDILNIIIEDTRTFSPKTNDKFMSLNTKKTIEYIHKNYDKPISIDSVSKMLNIHKCYFCNSFKQETGVTFSNFLCKFRIEKSKELLQDSSLTILDVAIAVGFNNQSYYTMKFKKIMNITPFEYRKFSI